MKIFTLIFVFQTLLVTPNVFAMELSKSEEEISSTSGINLSTMFWNLFSFKKTENAKNDTTNYLLKLPADVLQLIILYAHINDMLEKQELKKKNFTIAQYTIQHKNKKKRFNNGHIVLALEHFMFSSSDSDAACIPTLQDFSFCKKNVIALEKDENAWGIPNDICAIKLHIKPMNSKTTNKITIFSSSGPGSSLSNNEDVKAVAINNTGKKIASLNVTNTSKELIVKENKNNVWDEILKQPLQEDSNTLLEFLDESNQIAVYNTESHTLQLFSFDKNLPHPKKVVNSYFRQKGVCKNLIQ